MYLIEAILSQRRADITLKNGKELADALARDTTTKIYCIIAGSSNALLFFVLNPAPQ